MRKAVAALTVFLFTASIVMAKGGGQPPNESSVYNPFVVTMIVIMAILLLAIGLLANVVIGAAGYYYKKQKENEQQTAAGAGMKVLSVIALLLMMTAPSFAQDAAAAAESVQTADSYSGLSATTFYFMVGVIAVELLVVFVLLYQLRVFLGKTKLAENISAAPAKVKPAISVWQKLNKFKPIEQEADIDLGHDYDGIRELDNRLPPWWLYGFYISILFAGIYLWRYHISQTAPLSHEEFQIAMNEAEIQKAAYLKKSANNVDENTVKKLTASTDLEAGQKVFTQNCAACHGKAGEGIVGPNLTDDYWLHGGGIKDVFKTIKYGWPEKGMRSWKDDLSPMQIAQVASYIKSIHGSNPPNAKPKQGDLYQEEGSNTDSVSNKVAEVSKN